MKYWEIVADRLRAQGWSYGIADHLTKHGLLLRGCTPRRKTIHRQGRRFVEGVPFSRERCTNAKRR